VTSDGRTLSLSTPARGRRDFEISAALRERAQNGDRSAMTELFASMRARMSDDERAAFAEAVAIEALFDAHASSISAQRRQLGDPQRDYLFSWCTFACSIAGAAIGSLAGLAGTIVGEAAGAAISIGVCY
jgi:hypothetical protein